LPKRRCAAAIAVAAAPVSNILRLVGSMVGVLLDYCGLIILVAVRVNSTARQRNPVNFP
jgi:hypothetical protein